MHIKVLSVGVNRKKKMKNKALINCPGGVGKCTFCFVFIDLMILIEFSFNAYHYTTIIT